MKRPPFVAALLGLASLLPLDVGADIGPPRRMDCFEAGAPCWIDGRDRGSCVDGECRLMAAPSASVRPSGSAEAVSAPQASTASPPAAPPSAGCACGVVVGDRDGETLALTLSLFSVVALTVKVVRRRRRVAR